MDETEWKSLEALIKEQGSNFQKQLGNPKYTPIVIITYDPESTRQTEQVIDIMLYAKPKTVFWHKSQKNKELRHNNELEEVFETRNQRNKVKREVEKRLSEISLRKYMQEFVDDENRVEKILRDYAQELNIEKEALRDMTLGKISPNILRKISESKYSDPELEKGRDKLIEMLENKNINDLMYLPKDNVRRRAYEGIVDLIEERPSFALYYSVREVGGEVKEYITDREVIEQYNLQRELTAALKISLDAQSDSLETASKTEFESDIDSAVLNGEKEHLNNLKKEMNYLEKKEDKRITNIFLNEYNPNETLVILQDKNAPSVSRNLRHFERKQIPYIITDLNKENIKL